VGVLVEIFFPICVEAIASSSSSLDIKTFNGMCYELWKLKMEDLLKERDQWLAATKEKKPNTINHDEWDKMNKKARGTI